MSPEGTSVGSKAAYSFNEIRVDPADPERVYVTSETLISSVDGGRTWRDLRWPPEALFSSIFGDVRTFWIDPFDAERMILGSDGGVFLSYDGGRTADHLYNLPLGEVYAVAVDTTFPYHVYAGLQDHEAWRGPINGWSGAVTLEDWAIVGLWDGMYVQVDPSNRFVYSTTQFGHPRRADLRTGRRVAVEPTPPEGEEYRYTWTTPLQISPHDPEVLYLGAQKLLRSPDRGDSWEEISPDLTTADPEKIPGQTVNYCTITTLAESAIEPGLLWVGTDDGRVHVSFDASQRWLERTQELAAAGAPADRWVSRVAPSRHHEAVAYVSKSGYRRDDPRPFLFRTADGGEAWRSIAGGLPRAAISVILEDPHSPDVLYVGNDLGVWVSVDGGDAWTRLPGLPTVPVRDLTLQERERDLVIGTYGRGLWVVDVWPLRELDRGRALERVHLFAVEPKPVSWSEREEWGDDRLYGDRHLGTPNEPAGLGIYYALPAEAAGASEGNPKISILRGGEVLAELDAGAGPGLQRVQWSPESDAEADPAREGARDAVAAGEVLVVLEAGGRTVRRRGRLLPAPEHPLQP
ncbi:MAG TPA: hypothetical protein VMT85_08310 [Thermoanaerobaculia bacterium]|nr:hypothetical protein [Thermoanaerobaculia bacterium]